jgi:hypothetical protein
LTEPRGLISSLVKHRGWRIAEAERIPHDLWPAMSLPELSAAEQFTVLLIGFDQTFKVHAGTRVLEIVPLESVTIERRYPLAAGRKNFTNSLRQEFAPGVVRFEGNAIVVHGRVEEHERVLGLLGERPAQRPVQPPVRPTKQVYTLRVQEQPVDVILQQLAERLKWAIEIDDAAIRDAGLSVDVRVSFAVENSSQDELLKAVLRPAELDYRREGERIRIVPREH